MQIKLRLTKETEESIKDELNEKNIEISEDAGTELQILSDIDKRSRRGCDKNLLLQI